jgi:hypothetical protein
MDYDRARASATRTAETAIKHTRRAIGAAGELLEVRHASVDIVSAVGTTEVEVFPVFDQRPQIVWIALGGFVWAVFGFWPMFSMDIWLFLIVSAPLLAWFQWSEVGHRLEVRWWKLALWFVALLLAQSHMPASLIYLVGTPLLYREVRRAVEIGYLNRRITPELLQRRSHGTPGLSLAGAADLDQNDVAVGMLGEQKTAAMLTSIATTNPAMQVFHSLAIPGAMHADIDHAIYAGDRIILIDTKHWQPGRYTIDPTGMLTCDGRVLGPPPINALNYAIDKITDATGYIGDGRSVMGLVVVHSNRSDRPVTIDMAATSAITFITADQLARVLDTHVANEHHIDRWAIDTLHALVKR